MIHLRGRAARRSFRSSGTLAASCIVATFIACAAEAPPATHADPGQDASPAAESPASVADTASRMDERELTEAERKLVAAAADVMRFLRGEASADVLLASDTVILRLSPEGGGARAALPRELQRDRMNWSVATGTGERQSLVPPPSLTELTLKPGVHFNCMEYDLATRAADLAARPHVGARLLPDDHTSCLQSWNLTLVFDTAGGSPTLIGAIYDQWEW